MIGSVRKNPRGDGYTFRYEVEPGPDGRRRQRSETFALRKDATARQVEVTQQCAEGRFVEMSKQTVAEYLNSWLEAVQPRLKATTWAQYHRSLTSVVIPRIGGLRLQQLGAMRIEQLHAELLRSGRHDGTGGLSPKSVRLVHVALRRALGAAQTKGLIATNPAATAEPPRPTRPEMSTWTAAEVREFLTATAEHELSTLYVVYLTTGLRRGEALGLRWADVDLEGGRLSIRRSRTTVNGRTVESTPKSDRGRQVSMPPETGLALRGLRKRGMERRVLFGRAYAETGYVFVRPDGRPLDPGEVSKGFAAAVKRAGLPHIRLHDARHTWATLALEAGVHPKVVQEQLGHSSISITLDLYSHVSGSMAGEAVAAVAALFSPQAAAGGGPAVTTEGPRETSEGPGGHAGVPRPRPAGGQTTEDRGWRFTWQPGDVIVRRRAVASTPTTDTEGAPWDTEGAPCDGCKV